MEERVSLHDAKEAAALIEKTLTARSHTGTDEDYAALLARWNASMLFRNLVSRMAAGLGLSVVGELGGESGTKLILRPNGPESPFTALPGDLTDPQHDLRRGEFAIILASVAAAYFRTAADVSTPQDHDAHQRGRSRRSRVRLHSLHHEFLIMLLDTSLRKGHDRACAVRLSRSIGALSPDPAGASVPFVRQAGAPGLSVRVPRAFRTCASKSSAN